jgi:hypothetical protein
MGMDVTGKKPTSKTGEYFRNNCWWWHPLWHYCQEIAPWVREIVIYAQFNDGDGLKTAKDSRKLADALQAELDSGRTAVYAKKYNADMEAIPDEKCDLCEGCGIRRDSVGVVNGFTNRIVENGPRRGETGWCNGCDGVGHKRPSETSYPFGEDNVREWVAFLRDCGGFEIH